MKVVISRVTIRAPRAAVWAQLVDFASWREWNPFLIRVDAEPREGAELSATGHLPPGIDIGFEGEITTVDPARELAWRAEPSFLPGGAFVVDHWFTLDDTTSGHTSLRQREEMSGWLAPFGGPLSIPQLQIAHRRMNDALRDRMEKH